MDHYAGDQGTLRQDLGTGAKAAVAVVTFVGALGLILARVGFSWLAHDDGTLALAGQRVLDGQWPHVDFDTPYSGGLALVNAGTFQLFGPDFVVMRYPLLGLALVTLVAAGWTLATVQHWSIVAVTLSVAAVWSVGLYPSPVPSWYQVFLAIGAGSLFVGHIRNGHTSALAAAGFIAGLSVLAKVTGLFTLAALLVALGAFVHQRWLRTLLVIGPVASAVLLVAAAPSWQRFLVLAAPLILVGISAWRRPRGGAERSWRDVAVLVSAALTPILAFLVATALQGDVGRVITGWFILPQGRFDFAASPAAEGATGQAAILGLLTPLLLIVKTLVRPLIAGTALVLVAVFTIDWSRGFHTLGLMILVLPLMLGLVLAQRSEPSIRQLLWVSVLAFTALLAFPASDLHQALFLVPVAAIAVLEVFGSRASAGIRHARSASMWAVSGMSLLALVFVVGVARGAVYRGALVKTPPLATGQLVLPTARFVVEQSDLVYNELIPFVTRVAGDRPIFAGPDIPQVYSLSETTPVTPAFFSFLTDRLRHAELLEILDQAGAQAVVLHLEPYFTDPVPNDVVNILRGTYTNERMFGRFLVLWKSAAASPNTRSVPG